MTNITTEYMGLKLKHPIVASCSPMTGSIDSLLALEDADGDSALAIFCS